MTDTISSAPIPARRRDARQVALLLRQLVGDRSCFWLSVLECLLDLRDRFRRPAA